MPAMPWKSLRTAEPGREYLALLSYLPLRHFRAIPKFFRFTLETQKQLSSAAGLIGYALDAQPFRKRFWTLSVWEDSQALMNFVQHAPHSRIMQDLAPHMDKTQFVQWKVTVADLPVKWAEAKARMR
jgi:hypothetical protein